MSRHINTRSNLERTLGRVQYTRNTSLNNNNAFINSSDSLNNNINHNIYERYLSDSEERFDTYNEYLRLPTHENRLGRVSETTRNLIERNNEIINDLHSGIIAGRNEEGYSYPLNQTSRTIQENNNPINNLNMSFVVGRICPSNPNKYSCFEDSEGIYYKCTYDNFKTVYFKWELTNTNKKDTTITVPKYIPSILHDTYLKFKLRKQVYMRTGLCPYYSDWEEERYNNIIEINDEKNEWNRLIDSGECYIHRDM